MRAPGGHGRCCLVVRAGFVGSLALLGGLPTGTPAAAQDRADWPAVVSRTEIHMHGAVIEVDFAAGAIDVGRETIVDHIKMAAGAVEAYFGRFPVAHAAVLVVPAEGRSGMMQGTTWGDMRGMEGFTRVRVGEHVTTAELAEDWMTTHELVHMGFPSLPDDQHWMEEGMATYIEPVARVRAGELKAATIWRDMARDMAKGEPAEGDLGIDRTHSWGRTYWGGALFCLVADVEIRRATSNKKGLEDAMRAIVGAGGTIDHEWDLSKALEIGDRATGTHVLTQLYADWKDKPVKVDLTKMWADLGVHLNGNVAELSADAPMAAVREAIASPPAGGETKATAER